MLEEDDQTLSIGNFFHPKPEGADRPRFPAGIGNTWPRGIEFALKQTESSLYIFLFFKIL